MAHFAKLDDNNIVVEVIVVNNDVITIDGVESEQAGIDFLTQLFGHNKWQQTSYNNAFRGKFASVGFTYNKDLDAFYPPKPYPSWKLNTELLEWEPPIPMPEPHYREGFKWRWLEENQEWIEIPA